MRCRRSASHEPTADLQGDWFYGLSKSELALIMASGLALGVVQACRMSCELSAENGKDAPMRHYHMAVGRFYSLVNA